MDATSDLFWPAMLFTLLAIIVAAVVLGRNKGPSKSTHQTTAVVEERAGPDPGASSQYHDKHCNETRQQLQSSAKSHKAKDETMKHVKDSNSDNVEEVCKSDSPVHSSTIGWGEDSSESGIRIALRDYAQSPGIE
ncbi:hypothetical protein DPX16_23738 [Anabarilius grahami]|uniref:Uncharacterized protein n=1 Tax=Anabarilius grahami TaxID=495550 RepID=A0A3N0Y1G6_ANAGA|nr:hypothetical protein DPX16_23738 [Anabarilius grahami]